MRRRALLGTVAGVALTTIAGCSDDGESAEAAAGENEVVVAPDGALSFEPETLTVTTGTTVTWRFERASHNVSCNPDHHESASLPDGADPFASYDGDDRFATNEAGTTFEHAFEVAGDYDYVCIPHVASDMVGTVTVESE